MCENVQLQGNAGRLAAHFYSPQAVLAYDCRGHGGRRDISPLNIAVYKDAGLVVIAEASK